MAQRIPRVPVREQDPKVRAHNFEEVCYGYNLEEATTEATRCLHCKNPRCVQACPVSVKIPEFIAKVATGDIAGAAAIIAEDSSFQPSADVSARRRASARAAASSVSRVSRWPSESWKGLWLTTLPRPTPILSRRQPLRPWPREGCHHRFRPCRPGLRLRPRQERLRCHDLRSPPQGRRCVGIWHP